MNVIREICSYLNIPFLPSIHTDNLRLYDLRGRLKKTVSLSQQFTDGAMYCMINESAVLCMGGYPITTDVFRLSTGGKGLTQLSSMHAPRGWFGLLKTGNFVYAFGSHPAVSTCEKFSLVSNSWTSLPDMLKPRHAFSPCQFHEEVYLPDPFQEHKVLETFNLVSELFKIVPVSLSPLKGISVAFISEGELFIITGEQQLGRWRILSSESEFRVCTIEVKAPYPVSSCPMVEVGREIVGVYYLTGNVMKFDIDTKQFTVDE